MNNNLKMKYLILCLTIFAVSQVLVWFQLNGQFFNPWFKKNTFILALMGVPISYLYIWGTNLGVKAFDGLLWPQRFIGFSVGILIFAILSFKVMNEPITLKTMLSLILSFLIILVQIFI